MGKRYIGFVLPVILIIYTFFSVPLRVDASELGQNGYIKICVNGRTKYYSALRMEGDIYLQAQDISQITSYDLDIEDRISYLKKGKADTATGVDIEFDGTVHAMGREYEINVIKDDNDIFLPINEMLYLLHAQWCVEGDCVIVQSLPYTIIDFLGDGNYELMLRNKVNQTDLLINGEGELIHSLRSSLAAVFNDFDPMMFVIWWPKEGWVPALNKEFEEALLQLAVDDMDFLDSYGQTEIAELLKGSAIGQVNEAVGDLNNFLDIPENLMDGANDIDEVLEWISELTQEHSFLKFHVYNDFSDITTETLEGLSDQIHENFGEVGILADGLDLFEVVGDVSEVFQRSQSWGEDFIDQIRILTDFDDMGYNTAITNRVKNVASNLIAEYEIPSMAGAAEATQRSISLFLNKIFDESIFGKYFAVFNVGLALAKTNESIKDSIDAADLSYMVDCLIKTEYIAVNEMSRSYNKILNISVLGDVTDQDINQLRNCVMLSLRANLRNHAFLYYLNEKLNNDLNWKNSSHAQEIRNQIIVDYVLLCQVMQTEPCDKLLLLSDFNDMYSDDYGMVRQPVTDSVFHEGEIGDDLLSAKNYYSADGELIYSESFSYYDNGLLCSSTVLWCGYSPEYTLLYLYDKNGNLQEVVLDAFTMPEWYDEDTGEITLFGLDGDYVKIRPAIEHIGQEKFGVDPSKTEEIYGNTQIIYTDFSDEWAHSYLNSALYGEEPTDMTECSFAYIDDNIVPELCLDYGYGYAGGDIYTVENRTTDSVSFEYGDFHYLERSNLLLTGGGHMHMYNQTIYCIENGKFSVVAEGDYGAEDNSNVQFDENEAPIYDYYWNGKKVTEEEYKLQLSSILNDADSKGFSENIFSWKQCKLLLQSLIDLEMSDELSRLYDGDKLAVSGTLMKQEYEINSDNKGIVYILVLDVPITKFLYSNDLGYSGENVEISEIQIQFSQDDSWPPDDLIGRHIQAEGSVIYGHSAHHLTTVLLTDPKILVDE